MKKIILDTNFLLLPSQFNIDIFEEMDRIFGKNYELLTTDGVIEELEKLSKSLGKDGVAAKIALELLKGKNIKIIKTKERDVDKGILKISDRDTIVGTNDKVLRKKLRKKGIKTIYLRGKGRILVE